MLTRTLAALRPLVAGIERLTMPPGALVMAPIEIN